VPLPIFYRDGNGFATGCNRAFEQLLNLSREEIAFLSLEELLPREQAQRLQEMDGRVRSERKTVITELSLPHASGEVRDYKYYLLAYNDDDEIDAWLSVLLT
jgi:PAS domain S-box-containing protein